MFLYMFKNPLLNDIRGEMNSYNERISKEQVIKNKNFNLNKWENVLIQVYRKWKKIWERNKSKFEHKYKLKKIKS